MGTFTVIYSLFPVILAAAGSLVLGQQFAVPDHGGEATFGDGETWKIAVAIFIALLTISVTLAAVGLVASLFA